MSLLNKAKGLFEKGMEVVNKVTGVIEVPFKWTFSKVGLSKISLLGYPLSIIAAKVTFIFLVYKMETMLQKNK